MGSLTVSGAPALEQFRAGAGYPQLQPRCAGDGRAGPGTSLPAPLLATPL